MKVLVVGIIGALMFSTGARLRVFFDYLANQRYYAEVLCQNKAVKNACCKGKCAVEKQLARLDEQRSEQAPLPTLKLQKAEEALCAVLVLALCFGEGVEIDTPFHVRYWSGYPPSLLRPPVNLI